MPRRISITHRALSVLFWGGNFIARDGRDGGGVNDVGDDGGSVSREGDFLHLIQESGGTSVFLWVVFDRIKIILN